MMLIMLLFTMSIFLSLDLNCIFGFYNWFDCLFGLDFVLFGASVIRCIPLSKCVLDNVLVVKKASLAKLVLSKNQLHYLLCVLIKFGQFVKAPTFSGNDLFVFVIGVNPKQTQILYNFCGLLGIENPIFNKSFSNNSFYYTVVISSPKLVAFLASLVYTNMARGQNGDFPTFSERYTEADLQSYLGV